MLGIKTGTFMGKRSEFKAHEFDDILCIKNKWQKSGLLKKNSLHESVYPNAKYM